MVARVLQAMAVGILMPLMQVVSLSLFDAESRGKAMGLGGLVIGGASHRPNAIWLDSRRGSHLLGLH